MINTNELIENAHDILTEVHDELELTAALATFTADKLQGVVISSIGGGKVFSFTPQVGYEFPLHASGPGKALLSGLPPDERKEIVDQLELTDFTEKTITGKEELLNSLSNDQRKGFSIDDNELVVGINCVSAPVFDKHSQVIAAIWVTAPIVDLPDTAFESIGKRVKKAAGDITSRFSGDKRSDSSYMNIVIKKAQKQMEKDLSKKVDVELLTKELNVGYDWFRKKFKQTTGESPNQYHTRLRIEKAQSLLEHTQLSVKEIALQLGYDSQDYFSAFFKKKTGISPQNYRERR